MSTTELSSETAVETTRARTVDMKLEVIVIPVSDVDRSFGGCHGLGGLTPEPDPDRHCCERRERGAGISSIAAILTRSGRDAAPIFFMTLPR